MENKVKINYFLKSLDEIKEFEKEGKKPSVAMHACCGPCAAFPIEFMSQYFGKITIIFNNSNIYPKEEYVRRLDELKKYIRLYNEKHNTDVELVIFDYKNEEYNKILDEYGDMNEGLARCQRCYRVRMDQAYAYADTHGYDYFCTVMTISRQKSSQIMNEIGIDLSKKYKTKYFLSDFKKNKGCDRARELKIEYDLYNQQYCGCIYSYDRYQKKLRGEPYIY